MITQSYMTLAIVVMALITFATRYAFFTRRFQINLHPRIKHILTFTAPCILTAMAVPIVFQGALDTSATSGVLHSSFFWGGLLAIALSIAIRHTLVVILLSMVGFYTLRYFGLS